MRIRELGEDDAGIYWPLRLRALREEPESFGSSYEEAKERPVEQMAERLRVAAQIGDFTLGAFDDDQLVGVVTLFRETGRKNQHIAIVVAMYVAPETRGQGVGRALVSALIARARALDGVEQLLLAVVASNAAARALYRSLNFEVYGLQRKALKLGDGRYLDEELMVLWL